MADPRPLSEEELDGIRQTWERMAEMHVESDAGIVTIATMLDLLASVEKANAERDDAREALVKILALPYYGRGMDPTRVDAAQFIARCALAPKGETEREGKRMMQGHHPKKAGVDTVALDSLPSPGLMADQQSEANKRSGKHEGIEEREAPSLSEALAEVLMGNVQFGFDRRFIAGEQLRALRSFTSEHPQEVAAALGWSEIGIDRDANPYYQDSGDEVPHDRPLFTTPQGEEANE